MKRGQLSIVFEVGTKVCHLWAKLESCKAAPSTTLLNSTPCPYVVIPTLGPCDCLPSIKACFWLLTTQTGF